jgi:glycerol-3-phosphate dehydrogenase
VHASAQDFAYDPRAAILDPVPDDVEPGLAGDDGVAALARLPHALRERLRGRHGAQAAALVGMAAPADLAPVPGTATLWAELHWALRHEQVRHLDDLLLRRTRLGLLLPAGAQGLLPRIEPFARETLRWSAGEWRDECERYAAIVARSYSIPAP